MIKSPKKTIFISSTVRWIGLLTAIFFIFGCATSIKENKTLSTNKTEQLKKTEPASDASNKSHIYHFVQSELCKKKGDFKQAIFHIKKAIKSDPESPFLKMELVKLHIYNNEVPNALVIIEEHLITDPENIEFLTILAQIKISKNNITEVIDIYKKILAVDPKQQSAYYLLGGIYSKLNRTDEAIDIFARLVEEFPNAVSGYFYLGKLCLIKKDVLSAEKAFNDSLAISPDFIESLYALADLYELTKNESELLSTYKKIIGVNPNDLRASLALICTYEVTGSQNEAKKLTENIWVKASPNDIANGILKYYLKEKKYNEGTKLLLKFIEKDPKNDELLYLAGTSYNQVKNKPMAMEQFGKILPDSTHYTNAILIRAFHYRDAGNTKKAISILKAAHINKPKTTDFILYLGAFHEETDNFDEALAYYKKGISIDEKNTPFHFREGVILDKQNKRKECIEKMKIVIHLDPENTNALNYLGYTYADMGLNLNEAEQLIKKALSYKPDDAYITDSLGWLYYKKGDIEKATALLKKAVNLVPDDPILLEHLGDVFHKTENTEKALEFYRRSLKNKKKDKEQLLIKIDQINKERLINDL